MTWVKLDDQFPGHPKVIAAGPQAGWLYVCGLCYCSRYLTDGYIPDHMLEHLANVPKPRQHAATLERLGLWQPAGGGWWVHDYSNHQRTKAQIERERNAASQRQSRRRHGVTSGEVTTPETEADTETDPLSISSSSNEEGRRSPVENSNSALKAKAQQALERAQAASTLRAVGQ